MPAREIALGRGFHLNGHDGQPWACPSATRERAGRMAYRAFGQQVGDEAAVDLELVQREALQNVRER